MSSKQFSLYQFDRIKIDNNDIFLLIENSCQFGFSEAEEIGHDSEYYDIRLKWTAERIVPHLFIRGQEEENAVMCVEKTAYVRILWKKGLVICIDIGSKWSSLFKMLKSYCKVSQIDKCDLLLDQLFYSYNSIPTLLQTVQKVRVNDIAIETISCASLEIKECSLSDLSLFLDGTKAYIDKIILFFSHTEFSQMRLQKNGKVILVSRDEWDRESSVSFIEDVIDKSKILEI